MNQDQIMEEKESATAAPATVAAEAANADNNDDDEGLEDGEIDDDDDDEEVSLKTPLVANNKNDSQTQNGASIDSKAKATTDNVATVADPLEDSAQQQQAVKSKKPKPIDDDHASSIEHALANALKKKGIEPVLPAIDPRDNHEDQMPTQQGSSRSSRRRKRKKQRDENEKHKEREEKKRSRHDSPEPAKMKPALGIDDDDALMDEYEMLNVRGGSPPLLTHLPSLPMVPPLPYKDTYDSADDSNYSYDESYDSTNDIESPNESRKKRRSNKKDRESRKRRDRGNRSSRDDGGRQDKRSRRGESPERQEPRKLELCKFYLMECCAKRDKCSYMHSDFPCKYYYLGMECSLKEECKFAHGEPLTEQLRNILLKHLETAPKEILGNFKRITRDQAMVQMKKRHEELCKQFGVENIWSSFPNLPNVNHNRRSGGGGGGGNNNSNNNDQQHQQYHNQHQHQQQFQQHHPMANTNSMHSNIPSLLDMVIKPPTDDLNDLSGNVNGGNNSPMHDKQRKSRWNENSSHSVGGFNKKSSASLAPPPNSAPSYLDLKNLTGILSEKHMAQLSELGIVNLEQVNQLTVGQLNQIGLTIAEINEIQLNAKNMAHPGGNSANGKAQSKISKGNVKPANEISPMPSGNSEPGTKTAVNVTQETEKDDTCTNSNSNSSSGVVMVDYTQYLKDSNLPFDRGDDDERDDEQEQLIIDDGNTENDESPFGTPVKSGVGGDKKRKDSQSDSEQPNQSPHHQSLQKLKIPDFSGALRNPFKSLPMISKQLQDPRVGATHGDKDTDIFRPSRDELQPPAPQSGNKLKKESEDSDDECYYASRGRRSRSVTPTRSNDDDTPEASLSPQPEEFGSKAAGATLSGKLPRTNPKYERSTIYDFEVQRAAEEDKAHEDKSTKADKDMRFLEGSGVGSGSDIDLRLPFLPVTNYTPASEIDASITSHLPMTYKVYEVDVKTPSYVALRRNFKSDQTSDPRLRRILGLPETSQTRTTVALSRSVRKISNTIASPESSDGASPKYYTPSMSTSAADERIIRLQHHHHRGSEKTVKTPTESTSPSIATPTAATPAQSQPRMDPRRAARQAAETATQSSSPTSTAAAQSTTSNNANKQNIEIRNYLQKSDWYKNLNSKFKIMVNQQLALVSTELKKFHQDQSPNKIFDISFIVNNATLQQILTNLGIYIDDNGEVSHIEGESDESLQGSRDAANVNTNQSSSSNLLLPNLSQPPPLQQQHQQQQQTNQMDFLRNPPPNLFHQNMNMQFPAPPPNARPSLLGLPPVAVAAAAAGVARNPFNPFAGNMPVGFAGGGGGNNQAPNLLGAAAPSLLGPGPGAVLNAIGFGNFGAGPNMQQQQQQQRNFGGNQQQRNQRQRRNNFNGK